jgi:catechol 2,3-dioxygenase-like lactoylglutathione lyase family enzyme
MLPGMNPNKLFPLVFSDKLTETRLYYTNQLGAKVVFDQENYLQLRFGEDDDGPEIAFMVPQTSELLGGVLPKFPGQGLLVSIPTDDADKTHARMEKAGAEIRVGVLDKPWGWRSFVVRDPNGVLLDFFHVLEQSAVADATG